MGAARVVPVESMRQPYVWSAPALSVEFEDRQLRYVRCAGHELMCAIAFIIRDEAWRTYGAEIGDLECVHRVQHRAQLGLRRAPLRPPCVH